MSNFSFSHSVFKRLISQGRQKVSLCGNGLNRWSNFEMISRKCSLDDPFQKLFALVNGGYLHYTTMREVLKESFSLKLLSDLEINSQKCSLGDPFQNRSKNFGLSINMALVNGGLLALYGHEEILEKYSSLNPLFRF